MEVLLHLSHICVFYCKDEQQDDATHGSSCGPMADQRSYHVYVSTPEPRIQKNSPNGLIYCVRADASRGKLFKKDLNC